MLSIAAGTLALVIGSTSNSHPIAQQQTLSSTPQATTHLAPQTLNPIFALKLAKQAAMKLSSPPRIWQDSQAELNAWSLTPNLATTYEYFNCGIVPVGASAGSCMATATLIPIVQPHANAGYTVKLQVNFGSAQSPSTHTWEFWVKDPKTIEFVADTGVPLLTPRQ